MRRYWFQQYCIRGRKIWYKYLTVAHQFLCCFNLSVALAFSQRIICIAPLGKGFFAVPYDITFPCLFQPIRLRRNFAFKSTFLNDKTSHLLTSRLSTRTPVFLRSTVAGRIYNLCANHSSNSGFDRTFMPCSGFSLCAAEQRAGYQISWVNLQREANPSENL